MRQKKILFVSVCFLSLAVNALEKTKEERPVSVHMVAEYGFSGFTNHTIRFSETEPPFDYVGDGKQDLLFPFLRFAAGITLFSHHVLELLYQPIYVETETVLRKNFNFDNVTFNAGEPLNSRYYFPFYRLTYFYKFFTTEHWEIGAGAGIQIRNATIVFSSTQDSKRFDTRSLGPVPLLAFRAKVQFENGFWVDTDLAGFYANLPILNGGSESVTGWIYDTALRGGYNFCGSFSSFLSVRVIGGGAQGSGKDRESGGKYNENVINTVNASVGLQASF